LPELKTVKTVNTVKFGFVVDAIVHDAQKNLHCHGTFHLQYEQEGSEDHQCIARSLAQGTLQRCINWH
jgi:hypothetical protein